MSDLTNELLHDRLTLATPEVRSEYLWPAMAEEILTLRARTQAVRDLHKPVNVEPSCTFCAECSSCLPNGHYMLTVQYPCPTIRALDGGQ